MADYKKTVALEIGAQSVAMALFTPAGRGYTLSRYARRDILLDPVEEGMRIDYVSNAIKEMVAELKVSGSEVRNVVSGQQVFLRFIKLPPIEGDLAEQVGYEAQQQIPFPIDQIQYSYQELSDTPEGDKEVLLVAIKKDVLDNLNGQVESNGLKTKAVDCSITSLYNAYRANHPEETDPVMILDIGAKTTDILFSENGRFFTRSVTAAGAFITNAVSREFKMSYRDAEQFKVAKGVVSLGNGHTDSMEPDEAALATCIRNAMSRLCSEVQRTITHYRSQYHGNPPSKVYICGGGARLPYVVEFLQATLNLPVEYLNTLGIMGVGPHVDADALQQDAVCMGPLVGAAVCAAKAGQFSIDLVPTSVGKDRAEKEQLPKVIVGGVVALIGASIFAANAASSASDAAVALKRALPKAESVEGVNTKLTNVKDKYDKTMRDIGKLGELYSMRAAYADVMRQLSERCASVKFWVSEFSPLINYDVEANTLSESSDVKGTRLIDMNSSRNASINTAINKAPEEATTGAKKKAPAVTAIFVSGFTIKPVDDDKTTAQRQAVYDMVAAGFDERSADSLFAFETAKVQKDLNCYFQFVTAKSAKDKMPPYVEKFMMVMPLKNPIPIPELDPANNK